MTNTETKQEKAWTAGKATRTEEFEEKDAANVAQRKVERNNMDETITITIKMGNDAMQDDTDLAYVLRCLADRIEGKGRYKVQKVMDINGNTVGTVDRSVD